MGRERAVGILIRGSSARPPLVEGLPCRLDSTNDAVFEIGAVLLHDDDGFLEEILFENLLVQLLRYSLVDEVANGHGWHEKIIDEPSRTHGSALAGRFIGVFLKVEMPLASSPMSLAEDSLSLATLEASLAVSF